MRRLLPFLALLLPLTPAQAAERSYFVGDFDRVRIEGPFDVRLATRGTPAARVTGSMPEGLDIHVDSNVLIVRAAHQAAASPADASGPTVVYLRTIDLHAASVIAGGALEISGAVRGPRVDLQVSGSGSITALGIAADQVNATLIGAGTMTLGGRAAQARLVTSGAGSIEATALAADALVLRLDGSGATHASARYTADVATTGLGAATVYGSPKCKLRAGAGGPIACGVALPAAQ